MAKKLNKGDMAFKLAAYAFVIFIVIITLYPMLYILSCSISDPDEVIKGSIFLFPKKITLEAYRRVINDAEIWLSYRNTIVYVTVGTLVNLFLTFITGYPLSRRQFKVRNTIMMFFAFTMWFNGGLVPTFLVVRGLGLIDSMWALILPSAISTYNLILVRTFLEAIPEEIQEAAKIDGAGEWYAFYKIILPLSKPILAVISLFCAVAHWNTYFSALIYLNDEKKYPLQMVLRKLLVDLDLQDQSIFDASNEKTAIAQTVRYSSIIVATVPILCIYPFLQKYFVKGALIGAIKS
ncbi:MAG: carbohydrate ABC transporter permease [Clostridiaceae bacterium]